MSLYAPLMEHTNLAGLMPAIGYRNLHRASEISQQLNKYAHRRVTEQTAMVATQLKRLSDSCSYVYKNRFYRHMTRMCRCYKYISAISLKKEFLSTYPKIFNISYHKITITTFLVWQENLYIYQLTYLNLWLMKPTEKKVLFQRPTQ